MMSQLPQKKIITFKTTLDDFSNNMRTKTYKVENYLSNSIHSYSYFEPGSDVPEFRDSENCDVDDPESST